MPNPSIVALIVSEISALIRTEGQTDMARSTRLVVLIKNILYMVRHAVTYFPTYIEYRFTLRVMG